MKGIQSFALIVFGFHIILLGQVLPAWLLAAAFGFGIWKFWILRSGSYQPPRLLVGAIALLLVSLSLLEYSEQSTRQTMFCLVCVSSLITCLDRPHPKQIMLAHSSFFGLLICILVMRGSPLPLFIYCFLTVSIIFSLMLHHLPESAVFSLWPFGRNILKLASYVAGFLLPIYFFFPDFRPPPLDTAVSGLADGLEPGRIAKLALSDRAAFQVRFLQSVPSPKLLYWRVGVLEDSFGMIWRPGKQEAEEAFFSPQLANSPTYELIYDSRLGSKLPLLEHSYALQGRGKHPSPIWWQPHARSFRSQNSIVIASGSPSSRFAPQKAPTHFQLKLQISPRVQSLVNQLQLLSTLERINFLQIFFRDFQYSLTPGVLSQEDALDDFLFSKKIGFCEHFAAAFATLLQLAGTSARIVTGFQGGEALGSSQFMLLRDSDAHAWTEVFYADQWHRIDPTDGLSKPLKADARFGWLSLPLAWIEYSTGLVLIGIKEWTEALEPIWLALMGILLLIVPLQMWHMQRRKKRLAAWEIELKKFLRRCEKMGQTRRNHEGMNDFLKRLAQTLPKHLLDINQLAILYQQVVYGPDQNPDQADELSIKLKKLQKSIF